MRGRFLKLKNIHNGVVNQPQVFSFGGMPVSKEAGMKGRLWCTT